MLLAKELCKKLATLQLTVTFCTSEAAFVKGHSLFWKDLLLARQARGIHKWTVVLCYTIQIWFREQ